VDKNFNKTKKGARLGRFSIQKRDREGILLVEKGKKEILPAEWAHQKMKLAIKKGYRMDPFLHEIVKRVAPTAEAR